MKKLNLIKKTGCCCSTIDIREEDIAMDYFEEFGYNMDIRGIGEFSRKAFFLSNEYDYAIGKDSEDRTILVPLKKK